MDGQSLAADRTLAALDARIPALHCVLDDGLLPALLGEDVRITRARYKPRIFRLLPRMSQSDHHSQPVLLHGDFARDHVLVQGSTVRIIDFDRIQTADPAVDIGSFAATEEISDHGRASPEAAGRKTAQSRKAPHPVGGYRRPGDRVSLTRVDTWAAFRLFLGSVELFRDRAGNWPADTSWRIRRVLELIT